jgi:hypothetical protein
MVFGITCGYWVLTVGLVLTLGILGIYKSSYAKNTLHNVFEIGGRAVGQVVVDVGGAERVLSGEGRGHSAGVVSE